ncbi:MAG: LLM class F420-dependent oxidoreductase [Caldilineaceae bacterium]
MKIGLQISRFNWDGVSPHEIGGKLAEIAHTADSVGFDSLWVMDHFFQMEMPARHYEAQQPMMDGYTLLAYMAGHTKRATLGTMVTGVHYRQPGHLIKIVTALDVISGGRAMLGIGAGWYERESHGLGFPFPPLAERFERLEETLKLAHQMWRDDASPFQGKHYQLAEPINHPQPLSKPHPPILIGGGGEKKTLRLAAQYADACNLFAYGGPNAVQQKLDVLKAHCDEIGRDYNTIERTTLDTAMIGLGGTTAEMIDRCRQFAAIGVQQAIFNMPTDYQITPIETIGREVIPAIREF